MLYSISLTQSLIHGLHSLPTFSTEAAGFLYTLFLFMKSDVTTTIVPAVRTLQSLTQGSLADNEHSQVALGVSLVGIPTASAFLEGLLWLALHLLAFDVSVFGLYLSEILTIARQTRNQVLYLPASSFGRLKAPF